VQVRRVALLAVAPLALAACGAATTPAALDDAPPTTASAAAQPSRVVVTTTVLGAVVRELVGGAAEVVTVIPDGADPHAYEPSARDIEAVTAADVVVANGLGLEEGLEDVLARVEGSGVPVVHVADHVTVREPVSRDVHDDEVHGHDAGDPHLWLSPATIAEAVPAMADVIGAAIGVDLSAAGDDLVASLGALDERVADVMGALPACELVTGHDELGYFADRYGCEVIGAVIPGLSTTAEATARDVAALREVAEARGVRAIFTASGTPSAVAARVAADVGVPLVELRTHALGPAATYGDFVLELARTVVDALAG
jgi:zinc/manganese transport system substrate-binding protein